MIRINFSADNTGPCQTDTDSSLTCEGLAPSISMILYVDYTKGTESGINLTIDLWDTELGKWFPLQQFNGETVDVVVFHLTSSGKYRIPVPTGANEEKMRVNISYDGTPSADSNVDVVVKPEAINM